MRQRILNGVLLAVLAGALGCGTQTATTASSTTASTPAAPAPPPGVTSTASTACALDPHAATTTTGSAPMIMPGSSTVTMYPGATVTLPVAIAPASSGAAQTVVVGASTLPAGLSVQQVTSQTGATANLTLVATSTLASSCFNGTNLGLDAVTVPLVLEANSDAGEIEMPIAVNVVLENPAFTPATTDLPVIAITTAAGAPIVSTDDYVTTSVAVTDTANTAYNYAGTGEIKGHGNTTWNMPKKPYKIKLDSKASLLGMKKAKDWILLANYDDKSMLRTSLAFEISSLLGMTWTPSTQFAELYLNGAYQGTYQLSEEVEIDPNRLDITEVTDTANSGDALTGGYLLEIDFHYDEDFMTSSPRGLAIGSQDPNPPTSQQEAYLTQTIATAENALYAPNYADPVAGWRGYFDQASLVNWYLAEELMGNNDAAFFSSDFFFKLEDDPHFYMGPVWDFDVSSGNVNYSKAADPTVPWVRDNALWYEQLFTDPAFAAAVQARWTAVRPQFTALSAFLDTSAATLATAQANNYARWPTLGELVWPNTEAAGSYSGEVDFLKSWLAQRLAAMDALYLTP